MNLREVEERLGAIGDADGIEFLYELLAAYGLPNASISRLRSGTYDKAERDKERLWKGKVWFRDAAGVDDDSLYTIIDAAKGDAAIKKLKPRFLIVTNGRRILSSDTSTGATLDITPGELAANASFFLPWAGVEKTQLENVNVADVKAAEKMAKLYDEIQRHNEIATEEASHDLNVFFSRLLFCFFAEDTGVFEPGSFTNAIGSLTQESGADTAEFLDRLFVVLDTEPSKRGDLPPDLRDFGYVNGKLFERRSHVPTFTAKARAIVLECGTLDWSQINPDIFGSMIQAVVQPGQRAGLGMHYTSVENIMKVIRPLFLNELEATFAAADTVRKLDRLHERINRIQVFDPACGSGNFLVIAYKELRRLEHQILIRIGELEPQRRGLFTFSRIELDSFSGIEIDDFAHEIAILSLWLAKHQMNIEFRELFGAEIPLIPLVEAGQIVCANAARIDWEEVCDASERDTYVCGNPPYAGSRVQTKSQKADFDAYFEGQSYPRDLDYISLWLLKGASFLSSGPAVQAGFVSTNSVCQGEQVGMTWPRVLSLGAQISFAHQSFLWSNSARGGAGVSCVIVGMCVSGRAKNLLYAGDARWRVRSISPYLSEGAPDLVVYPRRSPLSDVPRIALGSKPADGGHLILSPREAEQLVRAYPRADRFLRRYGGGQEALRGRWRACLWIADDEISEASEIPEIAERLDRIRRLRGESANAGTRKAAAVPHRFVHRAHRATSAILIPEISSERRNYVPLDFVGPETVISNTAYAIYDAEPWLFGLLQSLSHGVWVRAVAGRMKTDIRYSAGLVYNTFTAPELSAQQRAILTERAIGVLGAREQFPDRALAELYDPDKTPDGLVQAHRELDEAVDLLYDPRGFKSNEERLARLFEMYEAAVAEESVEEATANA